MTDDELDGLVKEAVAPRLKVEPKAVTVSLHRSPSLGDHVVFNANRAKGSGVNGLVTPAGDVVAGGEQALEVVFDLWGDDGSVPADERAEIVTWLLGGHRHVRVVHLREPLEDEPGPVVAGMLAPPVLEGGVLRFWWSSRTGLARVEVSKGRKGLDHEVVQAFEFEDGTYDPAGFDAEV